MWPSSWMPRIASRGIENDAPIRHIFGSSRLSERSPNPLPNGTIVVVTAVAARRRRWNAGEEGNRRRPPKNLIPERRPGSGGGSRPGVVAHVAKLLAGLESD